MGSWSSQSRSPLQEGLSIPSFEHLHIDVLTVSSIKNRISRLLQLPTIQYNKYQ
jgi:hypothetical protein